jgi:hypothetical protein
MRKTLGPSLKLKPRNFRCCGSATALFASLTLSLSSWVMKRVMHHSLTRPFAANVDIAVVRVANEAMSAALQLAVEVVEHEIAEQWRKWAPVRGPIHAGIDQPVLHHPGRQERPDEFEQPPVLGPFGDLPHQFVVIDSIEKLFQIEINHPAVTFCDIRLRLSYGLMS